MVAPFQSARAFLFLVASACAIAAGGCGSEPFQGEPAAEKTGTLSAALSTTGSDGATYRFVGGSAFFIQTGAFAASYPADGTETTFSKKLGVGNYSLDMAFGPYGAPVLVRELGGETSLVNATWTDTRPVPFTITAGVVTNLVLHFTVAGLANVTFATGDLNVSLEVTKDDRTQPTYLSEFANVTVSSVTFADPGAAYATALADANGNVRNQAVGVRATGPWTLEGTQACLPVDAASVGFDGSQTTFYPRLTQMLSGSGRLCIRDDGANDAMMLELSATGAVPFDQQTFLPDPAGYQRRLYVDGRIGDVFDGTTLSQATLDKGVTMTDGLFRHTLLDSTGTTTLTDLIATYSSGGTFTIQP